MKRKEEKLESIFSKSMYKFWDEISSSGCYTISEDIIASDDCGVLGVDCHNFDVEQTLQGYCIGSLTTNETLIHSPFNFIDITRYSHTADGYSDYFTIRSSYCAFSFDMTPYKTVQDMLNLMMGYLKKYYRKLLNDAKRITDAGLVYVVYMDLHNDTCHFISQNSKSLGIEYFINKDGDMCITSVK